MANELTGSINFLFNKYVSAKKETFSNNEVAKQIRTDIPSKIKNIINREHYLAKGSAGQGNWANVPWLAIFDDRITKTAQKGVYIVYLLSSDGTSLYLTLNQGCTQIRNERTPKETIQLLKDSAIELRKTLANKGFEYEQEIDLHVESTNNNAQETAKMYQAGTIFYKKYTKEHLPDETQLQTDLSSMIAIYQDYYENVYNKKTNPLVTTVSQEQNRKEEQPNTKQKIEQIKDYISSKGFTYENHLIENFYLSLKSKPFVILAGTSGTGKTRLAKLFAEAIGASENNGQFKLVPVRPDWSDSSDLFGHVNLNNEFIPGAILDFIYTASLPENKNKPYFLCLDEMNLARVEYYMSDFLSIIETRDFNQDRTTITTSLLMSIDKYGTDKEAQAKYGEINFPDNLYIVGTVNMDETTFPFSKKVLDRANTIEFSFVDLNPKFTPSSLSLESINEPNDFLKSKYLKLSECATEKEFIEQWSKELISINNELQNASLHIGYRVRDEIMFYMINNKEAGNLITNEEAFDNEIMQKILPRIQGSSQSIKKLLCALFKICIEEFSDIQDTNNTASEQMHSKLNSSSVKYINSAKKIQFMTRRLEEDGFTSYWL